MFGRSVCALIAVVALAWQAAGVRDKRESSRSHGFLPTRAPTRPITGYLAAISRSSAPVKTQSPYTQPEHAEPVSSSETPTSAGPPLDCTAAPGVEFSVHRCNETEKITLKILVKDKYNLTIPPASTTPPSPPTTPRTTSSSSEAPFPHQITSPSPSNSQDAIEYTTENGPSSNSEITDDYVIDDFDYMEEFSRIFADRQDIVSFERHRHIFHDITPYAPQIFPNPHDTNQHSWEEFCKKAAEEDEEPQVVTDGSFHPRYEEVAGVGVYRLHARPRTWAEARKVCEREGAQLAVPNSRTEALALAEIHNRCPQLLPTHFNDYQYLGVHDEYSEGKWETIVGYPLNETGYVNWGFTQPDNAHDHGENCLSMNRHALFNDVPCWTELPFICEHA